MMEEPLNRGTSPSGDSNLSVDVELTPRLVTPLDERLIEITSKQTLSGSRTPLTKKAKRVRFFRNGDKFYTGVVMAVTPERYRSFDSLTTDLTRALLSNVTLPNGVRAIYAMDGKKVQTVNELEDGKCYVVSGQGELFKKVEYSANKVRRGSSLSGLPQSPAGTVRQINSIPACVSARIITLIRHGTKPRKVLRLLLNKRNAASLEHVFEAITEMVKLDCGAVRRVYSLSGKLVITLEQFFESEEVFLAYGSERSSQEDFELDIEESKYVQSFRRGPWVSKRQSGPMPVMPRKTGKRILTAPQVRTPSPSSLILPQPLRLHYAVGHVIGDGNFAVVRHCVHKQTNAEYAMKIVDKHKCQGKETMLASEVAILRQVCHPNIISLIAEQDTADQLFLVMELVKGGDLFDTIAAVTKFSEAEASVMIGHLTSALAYLHSHYIVHRDVKPENLLVEMEGSHVRCLKLGDFGLAQVVREPLYTVCGTPTYVAPEILEETGYGLKIDVWAVGVILYILLCGFPPFVSPENDQEELFERILSAQYEFTSPYWDSISYSAKQLICNMLQSQPELRFSAEDVLDHPWLVSFLGGEQTTAGSIAAGESPKQHRNQQCQPLRVATFEFDYKKQRCSGDIEDEGITRDIDTTPVSRNRWRDPLFINETFQKTTMALDQDETDNLNGNGNRDEPISLSADCLQDIRALTTSMNDLMNNMDDGNNSGCTKTPTGTATSLNSIPEQVYSVTRNNNRDCNSPVSSKLHSVNRRNGNSLSDIHSSAVVTPCRGNAQPFDTPKSQKCNNKKQLKLQQKNINKININSVTAKKCRDDDGSICSSGARNSPIDHLSQSTDGLSGSSDNNIETSDSFVNFKFANTTKRAGSSSTQSIESSESFENIRFEQGTKIINRRHKTKPDDLTCRENINKTPKNTIGNRNSRLFESKLPRAVQINGQYALTKTPDKTESSRLMPCESVKLRDKKIPVNSQTKRETKNKRFSYVSQYTGTKNQDTNVTDKLTRAVVGNGRKCTSTDELREEQQQKSSAKTNRYSLYYTPQLARKTYELDNGANKSLKNTTNSGGSRPTSWKTSESSKVIDELTETRKVSSRNRRSIMDATTIANKNKSRQSVHLRSDGKTK